MKHLFGKKYMQAQGFTLIEILVSISIFAILATMIYTSLNAVLSKNHAIRESTAVFDMAKNTLARISLDLAATHVTQYPDYQVPGVTDPPDPYRFWGDEDFQGSASFSMLRFVSTEHLGISSSSTAGLARIIYYVDRPGSRGDETFVLRRSDNPFPYDLDPDQPPYRPADPRNDPVLCENVESFALTFLDSDGQEYKAWDSDSRTVQYATPRAIVISLGIQTETGAREFVTRVNIPVYREPVENVRR